MTRARELRWPGLCVVLGCGALGCGGTPAHLEPGRHATTVSAEQRAFAPDLASRVDRSAHAAEVAAQQGDDEAQRDHDEVARLWQVALAAEVERIGFDRQRQQLLGEIEVIETARVTDEVARASLEQTIRRQKAAAIARAEAARMMSEAAPDETQRRGGDPARVEARREAARVLLDRSAATVAAAVALGADAATTDAATRAIEAARGKVDGTPASMQAAQQAFALAMGALGQARAHAGTSGPSAEEVSSLQEALAAIGLCGEATDEGVVIWIGGAFVGGRADLRPGAKALLQSLSAVLAAHAHGPVQAHALASATFPRAIAARRTQQVQAALAATLGERVTRIEEHHGSGSDDFARIVLPAYACSLHTQAACGGGCAR